MQSLRAWELLFLSCYHGINANRPSLLADIVSLSGIKKLIAVRIFASLECFISRVRKRKGGEQTGGNRADLG
jgi:hypothetical protein